MQTPDKDRPRLQKQIEEKVQRKLKAKKNGEPGIWFGLGMMGLVGWSIAVPTLLGAVLGLWLDRQYDDSRSYTLACLLAGLILGCFTAWSWLSKEHKNIDENK